MRPTGLTSLRGLFLGLAVLAAGSTAPCRADGPARRGALDPLRYRDGALAAADDFRGWESVRMLGAILSGSQMGPGDGWFRPSESRYDWKWLAARLDADGNGSVSREEYRGPAELFDRLDRDRSGALTADDFDWSERSAFARLSMPANMWFRAADRNGNGRLSREEWLALFEKAARGKGYLTADDLRDTFPTQPPRPQPGASPPRSGPSPLTLVQGLFVGELGSVFEGPKLGDRAPDFLLKTHDGKGFLTLSQFRGKPVVLIFGSFT